MLMKIFFFILQEVKSFNIIIFRFFKPYFHNLNLGFPPVKAGPLQALVREAGSYVSMAVGFCITGVARNAQQYHLLIRKIEKGNPVFEIIFLRGGGKCL
jgi:hypothetical protein